MTMAVLNPALQVGDAILCRMSDKVSRIATLATATAQVRESLNDTIKDLGAYALLWLAKPEESTETEVDRLLSIINEQQAQIEQLQKGSA